MYAILYENKYSLLFRSLIERPGDLMKDDINIESLFMYCKRFCFLCLKNAACLYKVKLQQSEVIYYEQLFLVWYSPGRTVM